MKGVIVYYSEKGSNRFLARKIAEKTGFELEEIRPRINGIVPLLLASLTNIGFGNRKLRINLQDYDTVILCGPIWMGMIIYPLKCFVTAYRDQIRKLYWVSCCGGGEEQKESRYGYETVFKNMAGLLGDRFAGGFAMPVEMLVKPEDDQNVLLKTRLSEDNFPLLEERFNQAMGVLLSS